MDDSQKIAKAASILQRTAKAALSFARDHGPISNAAMGDTESCAVVAFRLAGFLEQNGLKIVDYEETSE